MPELKRGDTVMRKGCYGLGTVSGATYSQAYVRVEFHSSSGSFVETVHRRDLEKLHT